MTRVFATIAAAFFATFALTDPALAGCPADFSAAACADWQKAQARPVYTGPLAQTKVRVVCAEMRQKEPSALAIYEGNYRGRHTARVITTFRNTGWKKVGKVYKKVICFPQAWIQKVQTFTVCGSIGHYYFNSIEAGYFKRQKGRLTADDIARMWKGG